MIKRDELPAPPSLWRVRLADFRGRGVYSGVPDQHRCIFIHIPKTAGSSVAESLFGVPSRHVPYTEYLRANPNKFRRYFKFAFVRNPWDRLVSTYSFLRRGGMNDLDRAWSERNLRQYDSFDDFVRRGLRLAEVRSWVHFRPQTDFVMSHDGKIMLDYIGRFETISEDFATVAKRLGIGANLVHNNSGSHAPFASVFSAETAAIVADVYARDARAFGYRAPL